MPVEIVPGNCLVCNDYREPVRRHSELDKLDAICERCEHLWFKDRYPRLDWVAWADQDAEPSRVGSDVEKVVDIRRTADRDHKRAS